MVTLHSFCKKDEENVLMVAVQSHSCIQGIQEYSIKLHSKALQSTTWYQLFIFWSVVLNAAVIFNILWCLTALGTKYSRAANKYTFYWIAEHIWMIWKEIRTRHRRKDSSDAIVENMVVPYFSFKSSSSATTGVMTSFVAFAALRTRISSAFAAINAVSSSTVDMTTMMFLRYERARLMLKLILKWWEIKFQMDVLWDFKWFRNRTTVQMFGMYFREHKFFRKPWFW